MFKRLKTIRKLDNSRLADDEYYEEDSNKRGVIDVGAENYDDIFSYYDLDGENVLDDEFSKFIELKAEAVPLSQELALHFHVENPTEEMKEDIDRAVKNHYKREVRAINRKLKRNTNFLLYMLFLSIISFGIYVAISLFTKNNFILELVSIFVWVFVWEGVNGYFLTRREIQLERLKKYRFVRADIEVYEFKRKKSKNRYGNNAKALNKILHNTNNNKGE